VGISVGVGNIRMGGFRIDFLELGKNLLFSAIIKSIDHIDMNPVSLPRQKTTGQDPVISSNPGQNRII